MNRIFIPLAFLAFFALSSCEKLTNFNLSFEQTIVIPASTTIDLPFEISTPEIESNSTSVFELNDTRVDLINEIKLTNLRLSITGPEGEDFSFLNDLELFLAAGDLEETRIAWKENVDGSMTTLTLDLSDANLKDYMTLENFSLRLKSTSDELLTEDYEILIESDFQVNAKLIR
jgi:hypothetical protein